MTLKCIAGILTPDEGHIELDGVTLYDSASRINLPPQRRQVGYLFQQYALFPNMTVRQNIAAAVRDKARRQTEVAEKLRQFRLEAVADQKPGQLSGGQQQRCALARILASEPTAILLDEPFSALDSYLKYQLELELAETLGGFPGTVLWVSHDRGGGVPELPPGVCHRPGQIPACDHPGGAVPQPRHRGRCPALRLQELCRRPAKGGCGVSSGLGTDASCGRPVPEGVCRIGIRAHHVQLAGPGAENAFSCTAVKVVEDVFSTIVLLRPEGAAPEAPLLRMELDKDNWQAVPDKDRLTVSVPPEAILLLES